MTLHHEKYKCKKRWIVLFIANPNQHYHPSSINKIGKGNYFSQDFIDNHSNSTLKDQNFLGIRSFG